jgi:co-chaperonin GroES (HSP10)
MPNRRAEMYVRPGDEVVYTRAPANDVVLNGEEYTVLHAEQHIMAVIEKEAA